MSAPSIATERLLLRAFRPADLAPLTAFYADEDNTRFIGGVLPPYRVYGMMSAYVGHWELYGLGWWAVEEKDSGAFVGYCGYNDPPDWPEKEIGWSILPAFRGLGYAPEAALAARAAIARLGGPRRLVSYIDPDNRASARVAEKLGARRDNPVDLRGGTAFTWRHPEIAEAAA